ncbi:glycosyltransferase family 32 protein [Odoribacter lunatus]|uniref:glycosyltransferase family 32 protein n=1 Tax=Odoribacter lunatus TaxID=2941335 RepID=UPI00203CE94B|nr:glycosyltransferase [Odoribacter lunatus]
MIPKIIHYCWFGHGKMPELALKCIASWKKYLPDYELRLWNEDNFDIHTVPYVEEAYSARKFAFVTDYVRLYALYIEGGIYMDTDVEVLKNLDKFLDLPAFSGFEDESHIPTGIMASEKRGKWVQWQLEYYSERHFLLEDGSYDTTTNVEIIGSRMAKEGFILKNGLRNFNDIITIYPKDYFCPKSHETAKIHLTSNTYVIHHFSMSWIPFRVRLLVYLKRYMMKIFGTQFIEVLIVKLQLRTLKEKLISKKK